jgi:hypothetical protein
MTLNGLKNENSWDHCGRRHLAEERYCGYCGTPRSQSSPPDSAVEPNSDLTEKKAVSTDPLERTEPDIVIRQFPAQQFPVQSDVSSTTSARSRDVPSTIFEPDSCSSSMVPKILALVGAVVMIVLGVYWVLSDHAVAPVPVSQTSADSKAAAMTEAISFLNRHFVISDNDVGKAEPTGFHADESRVIFESDYSDLGKPKEHIVESALAADLDPDSVRATPLSPDLSRGWLYVYCKNQKDCVSETNNKDRDELLIGPIDDVYSDKAKQYLRQILLMQPGQTFVEATKQSADSHKGEQFFGWVCKNFGRLSAFADRRPTVELVGPVMDHRREGMMAIVWLWNPQEEGWRSALYHPRYTGGPEKGKLMEDYWESHFTNGAIEATLNLSKNEVLCPYCPDDWEGWKFNLLLNVPREDDPTKLNTFDLSGTCNENWLKGESSPVVQPKDEAQQ